MSIIIQSKIQAVVKSIVACLRHGRAGEGEGGGGSVKTKTIPPNNQAGKPFIDGGGSNRTTPDLSSLSSKIWRLENLYKIRNEANEIVTFKMKPVQKKYHKNKNGKKDVVLKARQLGVSTYELINKFDNALFNSNWRVGIIAHEDQDAEKLFRIIKLAWDEFPLKNMFFLKKETGKELIFSHGSSISVALSFRSGTLSELHVSEMGKMSRKYPQRAEEVLTGSFPAAEQGSITVESTAEGIGGQYHDLWTGSPGNGFKKHFFPWFEDEKYQAVRAMKIPAGVFWGVDFQKTQKTYKLTDLQITWYWLKAQTLKDKLPQEYPCNSDEAFLQSGRPVFNSRKVIRCATSLPDPTDRYGAGLDTAKGSGRDWSVLTIVSKRTGEQVFTLRKQVPIDIFAAEAVDYCKRYNNALLAIESNSIGLAMIVEVKYLQYSYLFMEKTDFDKLAEDWSKRIGVTTTEKSKQRMVSELEQMLRIGRVKISDDQSFLEISAYQYDEKDSMGAPSGKNDDCVAALWLAVEALSEVILPEYGFKRRPTTPSEVAQAHLTKIQKDLKRQGELVAAGGNEWA